MLRGPAAGALAAVLRDNGFLAQAVQPEVLRIAPPLILTDEQADAFVAALGPALTAVRRA
jgi:acetylornithine aminotransferase